MRDAAQIVIVGVAREWHENWKDARTPYYASQILRRLEADVFPTIGRRIRNTSSPHWRGWLKPENRCLVPAKLRGVRAGAEPGDQEEGCRLVRAQ
jgi:hypothetical protein